MRKLLLIIVFTVSAFAQNLTTITASNIQKAGAPLSSGTLCFTATDANDTSIGFRIGGGGQEVVAPYCTAIANGGIGAFSVANPANSAPANINYRIEVFDQYSRVLKYPGVQFTGATFNLDNYVPSSNLPLGSSLNVLGVGTETLTNFLDVQEIVSPANPSGGYERWYADSGTHLLSCHTSSGGNCNPAGGGGSGTVTSVGLALPAIFSVSGSPVTAAGTLTGTLAAQNANQVFAAPASGGAAAPAFRTLVAADEPGTTVNSVANDTNVTGSIASQGLTLGWTGTLAAGRLNSNVVQSVSNDANVTGTIGSQILTLGWTGTLAKSRTLATTVYTDQSNTYSAGTQDFSAAGHTLPALKGTTSGKPATCAVGEEYFATDATAGQNMFYCTAANTWTQQLNSGGGASTYKLESIQTSPVTCDAGGACGATETNLMTWSYPASELGNNQDLRITMRGVGTTNGSPNVTLRLYFGSTVIAQGGWNTSSIANASFAITVDLVANGSPGASVACEAQGYGQINGQALNGNGVASNFGNTATINLATNANATIKLTAQWTAATAGNSITQRQMTIERLN